MALVGSVALQAYVPGPYPARAGALAQGVGNFEGPWYVGGDLSAPALIIQAGTQLTLMNEQGRLATGAGTIDQVRADWGEGPITGLLNPDQRQINWSTGTHWRR
jgi:hypothetical protein